MASGGRPAAVGRPVSGASLVLGLERLGERREALRVNERAARTRRFLEATASRSFPPGAPAEPLSARLVVDQLERIKFHARELLDALTDVQIERTPGR